MSEHTALLRWSRQTPDFDARTYKREHTWTFDGGQVVHASAAPAYMGSPDAVDPEEAYVASLASCHMLTFLYVASRKRFVVDSYEDNAVGSLGKNADGKMAITHLVLYPAVKFSGEKQPTPEELEQLHHTAHSECFIANSVKTEIRVEPRQPA